MCHCRVLANVLFPNWLVTTLLLGLLIFLTYKTAKKALSLHRCEVRYLAQREEQKCPAIQEQRGQGHWDPRRMLKRPGWWLLRSSPA